MSTRTWRIDWRRRPTHIADSSGTRAVVSSFARQRITCAPGSRRYASSVDWMPPLVSIIVPSYNQGRYIRETLDSIFEQGYRPMEVIVMDGGSTDETVSILESFDSRAEFRWWSAPDRGVVDAVNKSLPLVRGEIV